MKLVKRFPLLLSTYGPLPYLPGNDCLRFFGCQVRKNKLGKPALPGDCLRLIQREAKHVLGNSKALQELPRNRSPDLIDLGQDAFARSHATTCNAERGRGWV